MKHMSRLGGQGGPGGPGGGSSGGAGSLVVYTEESFGGEAKTFKDNDANVRKHWKGEMKSVQVQGNPWVVFPEQGFKGAPTFLEEGRYPNLSGFPGMTNLGAAKIITDDLGSPELSLFSNSCFTGESNWTPVKSEQQMKCVSVGLSGIWAVRAKDETVWVRNNKKGRLDQDTDPGETWSRITGGLKQLSVGGTSVWGVNAEGSVLARIGICSETPTGKQWASVDGEPMKHVSVSNKGHVWGVDNSDKIWYRKGANNNSPVGTGWKMVPGALKQISVGQCGVWGVNADQQVWYRLNTNGDPEAEGTGWLRVEGRFQQIFSGANAVLALAGNRDLYYRANVADDLDEKMLSPNREGTHWVRLEQDKEAKIIFKQMEMGENTLWAVDKDNAVHFKEMFYDDIDIHYSATVFGDEPEFKLYNFPAHATTCKVASGGWAIYSEPNYQGKVLYQIGSDCISNDPPSKTSPYKTWFKQIGSARPIRGQNYRTAIVRMTLDWSKQLVISNKKVVFSEEIKNETEDYLEATWAPTFDVHSTIAHRFELKQAQNIAGGTVSVIRGSDFTVEQVDPIAFEIDEGPPLYTGPEFHAQLASKFIFRDAMHSLRQSKKMSVIKLPPLIPPKCVFKVKICMYQAKVRVPFKAEFKIGFSPYFENGSESWFESGFYEGEDESNIKIELESVKIAQPRKVSKMINGLGDDM